MSTEELKKMIENLPRGSKAHMADRLNCDDAKITKALRGRVKSKVWMARLEALAIELTESAAIPM